MGMRKGRRRGLGFMALMTVVLCLSSGRMQAYAQKESDAERLIRYSSSYQNESEIPTPSEDYKEGNISYNLVETAVETVPVRDRKRNVSGQITYEAVTKKQEIPEEASMEIEDKESRKTIDADLSLQNVNYENERFQDGFEFSVVFHEYGADTYSLGEAKIAHDGENPPLDECRKELIETAGLSEDDIQIESTSWDGDAYQDEDGIWCRNAIVRARQRVFDCRAIYSGMVELPEYNRFRMRMEYEPVKQNVTEVTIQETIENSMGETESSLVENSEIPFWKRWIRYGLTVSISLFLIFVAVLGFRLLKKMAKS